ncbi:MAG: P-II family nitrogen regulator [bacterium]
MELLMIIINKEEYFEKILSILVGLGVPGATILDSQGMGQFLAYEVPLFAGLRQVIGERRSLNKTIMTLIEDKEFFIKLKQTLEEEYIDFTQPGMGIIFTLPVHNVIKSIDEIC